MTSLAKGLSTSSDNHEMLIIFLLFLLNGCKCMAKKTIFKGLDDSKRSDGRFSGKVIVIDVSAISNILNHVVFHSDRS